MKVTGLSRWGSLETGPCRKDGNAPSHDSSQRHPSACACACVCMCVFANDVIPSVPRLSWADRHGAVKEQCFHFNGQNDGVRRGRSCSLNGRCRTVRCTQGKWISGC